MAIFGEETHHAAQKMWNFEKIAYFRYTARRFWPQKWDFAKIFKTSIKQLYNKSTNQKWRYVVKKHTQHWEKCEISKWPIFGTQRAAFGPENGISPKWLKLPQNSYISSLKTKNGDIWWINTPCTEKNVKLQKMAYFWYKARRFWPKK